MPDSALTRTGDLRAWPHLDRVPLMHLIADLSRESASNPCQCGVVVIIPFCCKESLVESFCFFGHALQGWSWHAPPLGHAVHKHSSLFFRVCCKDCYPRWKVKHPDVEVCFLVATPTRSNVQPGPILADRPEMLASLLSGVVGRVRRLHHDILQLVGLL